MAATADASLANMVMIAVKRNGMSFPVLSNSRAVKTHGEMLIHKEQKVANSPQKRKEAPCESDAGATSKGKGKKKKGGK